MDNNNDEHEAAIDVINAINAIDEDGGDLFERIYLGRSIENIPDIPFRLLIHLSVTEIDRNACQYCTMLTEVIMHGAVTKIGSDAFQFCSNLQRIDLPEGLLRIEGSAFQGCTTLREIVIPASVQFIGDCAFSGCMSLERVAFTPRTTSIELGVHMFYGCTSLRFVTLPQNLQSVPACCFYGCTSLTHLLIPASVEQIGVYTFSGSGIQAIKISEEDEFIPGTIMSPLNLHSISSGCFSNCKSLTHIRIPPSVEEIGVAAFSGSGLRSIEVSEHVIQIEQEAFEDCAFLERVTFHSSNNLIMSNNIFANCPSLSVIVIYPWLWPKLFASMKGHPKFIIQFFRQYHTKILDFETPDVRLFRRLRRDRKRTATMIDD